MKLFFPLAAIILSLSSAAFAHGDDETHAQTSYDPANVEQKEFGMAGDSMKVTRTIKMDMNDRMRFSPASITVKQGETIRFVITNSGKLMHEMVLGTMQSLQDHADMMRKFPRMEHEEPHMTHVAPGKTEELVWTFNKPGNFNYACLIAGHFEAGMKGGVRVVSRD
ncbi:hypothetical protein GCM10027343_23940 [Noviherbaspirillum agri]